MASSLSSQATESDVVAYATLEICVDTEISILSMGTKLTYTIPVISADVRQISFHVLAVDGTVLMFDVFIHAESSLDGTPFAIKLKDYCCKSMTMYMSLYIPLILGRGIF